MHFDDLPQDAEYRAKVRAWLAANATPKRRSEDAWGVGLDEREAFAAAQAWQARKFDAGYGAITSPKAVGGAGGRVIEDVIFQQEEANYLVPTAWYNISIGVCMPTLVAFGEAWQKEQFVRPALRGEQLWCQLYSEPAAGSDLAGVRTRAERAGDDWIVTGQKVWTTYAQFAHWALLVARTNPDKPKHEGLTLFIVDMRSPGVEVRPIRQASNEREFNEVFLNAVRVPDRNRLGPVDGGWKVIVASLVHERVSIGGSLPKDLHRMTMDVARRFRIDGRPAIEDSAVRERIADHYLKSQGLALITARTLTAISKGKPPGPEALTGKLVAGRFLQDFSSFAMDLRGPEAVLDASELGDDWRLVQRFWFGGIAIRIAGGTDEIVKNTIAERVLGLPAEARGDKGIPFKDLPK